MRQIENADSSLQPPADGSTRSGGSTHFSPLWFLIVTVGGIFLAEIVAMLILLKFRTWPYLLQTLLDATIMVLMIFPLIYYFSLRPLLVQITKRQQAEKDLKAAYDEMELRVQERTEELKVANSDLEEEIRVRTQAEDALRQSEQRLSRAQEIAHLGSWELDLTTDQLTWSDEVYRIFGLQPQEFGATYQAFLEAVHPDDRVAVNEAYSGSIREGWDSYEIEHRVVKQSSGEVRIVHEKCEHIRDDNGQIIRSVGMVHDITERKQAEDEVQSSRAKLDAALASMSDAVFISDTDGKFIEFNNAFATFHKFRNKEECAKTLAEYPEFLDVFMANGELAPLDQWAVPRALRGEVGINIEYSLRRKDTGEAWVGSYSFGPIRDQDGVIVGSVVVGRDITERKRAEEVLRRFELISEHSRDIILFMNLHDGHILEANTAAARAYGYSRAEMQTLTIGDLRAPLTRELTDEQMAQANAGGILFETVHQRKDGSTFPAEVSSQGATINGTRTLISIVRDITERKQAEQALLQSEEKYRLIADNANDWIYWIKPDRSFQYVSPSCERVTGFSPLEFMNDSQLFLNLIHPEDRERVESHLRQVLEGNETHSLDYRIVTKTNEVRWISHSCDPVYAPDGKYMGRNGTNRDITERKQAEEQLRYQAALLSNVNDAIIASNAQFQITAWNSTAEALYGWRADEVVGHNGLEIVQTEWPGVDPEKMRNTITETGRWRGEATQIRKDGTRFPVEVSSIVLRDNDGQVAGYISVNRDITERKRVEQQLERSNQKLNEILISIQDDFYVLDREWNFVYASKLFTSKVGKEPEDFIGNNIWKMFPKHVGTVLEENFRAAMEKRDVRRFEIGGKYTSAWYRMTVFPSTEGITVLGTDITEQKQAEGALQKNEAMLRAVLNQMPSGVTVRDAVTGEVIISNARSREILGELVETTDQLSEYHGLHSDGSYYRNEEWPVFRSITTGEKVDAEEIDIERRSGSRGTLSVSSGPIHDTQGKIISGVAVFHDITERKKAERELQQLNRTLRAHTASNKAMLRATTETQLLNEVCKIIVEDCGHAMVWVGYAEDDEEKSVRPVANAGFEAGYLDTLQITWADTERGRGPTGTAIRTGKPSICRNMLIDPQFAPWREQALQRGYASSIVLPLISNERAFGGMTIYSRQPDAFSPDEEKLLSDLASDLAHGIEMIRLREAHERTSAALRESEERFRLALTHAPVTVAVQDRDLRYTWAYNQRTHLVDEIIGKTDFDLFPSEAERLTALKRRVMETGENASEQLWIKTNNSLVFLDLFIEPLRNEKGEIEGVGLATVDLTAIKQAEEELRMARDELELRVEERTAELGSANKELVREIAEREKVERQLRIQATAMRAAANGIVITDQHGTIEWTNPAMTQMTGYEIPEVIGQGMRLFQSGKHDAGFYGQLWETIVAGDVWRGEITNRRKDGNLYVEEQTITPVRDENGQISHFIAIKQDVTERNLMYAQLEESNRQLISLSMLEQQQRKAAEILSQASVALSETLDIQHVMETILDYIELVLPVDAAFLILSEGDNQYKIRCVRAREEQNPVISLLNKTIDLLNEPVIKPFFEKNTTTLIRDSQELEIWAPPPELAAMRNWLGIPLISTGRMIGIVVAANLRADFFTDAQVQLAEAVVSQATVALQNAWLFEQVRAGRERLQMLSRHLVEIQENERKFIARELHDETSQALTSLKLGLHSIEQSTDPESTTGKQIASLKTLADEILESLHRLAINLRPASLDHLGLVEALTSLVQSTGERSQISARFKCLGPASRNRLSEDIESSVYRIVQESLTNIVRHAKATYADVILEWQDDQIMIIVEDDGIGIDLTSARASGRLGLVGMQERAEMLGGKLLIESNPNAGTTLVVEIPYAY